MYATLFKPRILVPSYNRSPNMTCIQISKYPGIQVSRKLDTRVNTSFGPETRGLIYEPFTSGAVPAGGCAVPPGS